MTQEAERVSYSINTPHPLATIQIDRLVGMHSHAV